MDEQFRKAFSRNLKYYMAREGKTQADMVNHMNISSATASDWCNEKKIPRADKLQSLCNWLGITLSQLTDECDPYDKPQPTTKRLDRTIGKIADKIKSDAEYRLLFEAILEIPAEDVRLVLRIVKRLLR